MIRQKKKPVTLAQQHFLIRKRYGSAVINSSIKRNDLNCLIRVKPTEDSREYELTVKCKSNKSPQAYLINQGILFSQNDNLPHVYECKYYSEKKEFIRLCLYYPITEEWTNDMMIADTFIPWAIEWLYYYEIWRMTGKWLGGGHHGNKKE